jgi:hypothetical protein
MFLHVYYPPWSGLLLGPMKEREIARNKSTVIKAAPPHALLDLFFA